MNKITSLLVFFFIGNFLIAQTIGGFSAKLKWNELKSQKSNIIYNPEFEAHAIQVQGIIRRLQKKSGNIGNKVKNINLVLRVNSIVSNAYVGLAPFKSEFFLNPNQNNFALGSLPWTYLLSIHEYQHVLQFSNTLYGPTKWAYWFGGELAWGTVVGLTIPNWFFEGDAVRAETEYSFQGRGRIPYFLNGFRQMAYSNSNYSYEKARNGSLKDNVPNHYPLGYLMIKHGKEKYGDAFWSTILKETSKLKGILYPFSKAIKRNTGLNVKAFYKESLTAFYNSQSPKLIAIVYDDFLVHNSIEKKANKSLSYFQNDPKTNEQYLSSFSFNEPARIERIDSNFKSEKIHLQAIRPSNYFDIYNNKILYAAKYLHPRWNLTDYSDLVIYDIDNKKLKRITKEKRIFSPNFIENGNKIVGVEMDHVLNSHIAIYDLNGNLEQLYENTQGYYFNYPKEVSKNNIVVGLRDSLGRTNLAIFSFEDQSYQLLLPWTYHQIGIPEYAGDYIYFSASFSGIDHIYRVKIETKEINQVTFGKSSHYQVLVDEHNSRIYFQVFDLNGNQIKYLELDSIEANPFLIDPLKEVFPISFATNENVIPINPIPENTKTEEYSKTKHVFNFHSWTLNSFDPEYEFYLSSENILGTFSSRIGANYNQNENGLGYFANFSYSQFFPVFGLTLSNKKRSTIASNNIRYYWDQTEIASSISIPLDFSSRSFYKKLNLGITHSYSKINYELDGISDMNLNSLRGNLNARLSRLKARKNIFTHFGLYTNWSYENGINTDKLNLLSLKNSAALPGLFANHNLILDGDFQISRNKSQFNFSDNFNYARGYQLSFFPEDAYRLGFNYHFPILYPDKGAFGIVYLLRTRMNLFFDYSKITAINANSVGAELIFDLSLFNAFETSIGLRASHQIDAYDLGLNNLKYEVFIPLQRF